MFRPYGLDPEEPEFEKYLALHWGLDYNNGEPDVARAKAWYEEQKLKLERELENQRQLAPAPVVTVPARRRRRPA